MQKIFRFIILFFVIAGCVFILDRYFNVPFQNHNYWDRHGFWFLIFITLFPRLTLLFSNVVSGGFLWWLGWLFMPRFLVAILATISYWNNNPFLVVFSWLIAIGGESSEKAIILRKSIKQKRVHQKYQEDDVIDVTATRVD